MLVLTHDDLIGLLSPLQIVTIVEAALRANEANLVVMPRRSHADWGANTLLTMPVVGEHAFGVKIVSVIPGNAMRGLPVTDGVMIISDPETGTPLALLNAAALTAQRTGAVGALGVKYLTPSTTASIGIIGCGVQGAWQVIFACAVRPIKEVFALGRSVASFEKFVATVARHVPGVRLVPCQNVCEVLERTSVVITATTSADPVLPDDAQLLQNKHFISVGSYKPSMQELPDCVCRLAGLLAIDSELARHEAGDVINPLRQGVLADNEVFSIAECVTGQRTVDTARTTAYKSVGAALFDLYVAEALYRTAKSRGRGYTVKL
jgi:ornithine cyclodeaminase/alanine dehydrogenase-like protein (mu-crystallin family)